MQDDQCCTEALNYVRAQHHLKRSLDKTHMYFEPLISSKKHHQLGWMPFIHYITIPSKSGNESHDH